MPIQKNGYQTLVVFGTSSITLMFEKSVTPPGMDAGGPIDTTTMRNATVRTRWPKSLVTATEMTFMAAWDPAVYNEILAAIGVNQQISVAFPDGSILQFYGWLDKFIPGESKEGEQPTATCTIVPSNEDNDENEVLPSWSA